MKSRRLKGIYAITPDTLDTADLLARVEAALAGGVRLLQYRNKTASPALRLAQCEALLARIRAVDGTLIVNDDYRLAEAVGADGVHLGKDDGPLADARSRLGPERLVGVSCYNDLGRALRLRDAGADYVAFGRFFPSATKPEAVAAPVELLSRAVSQLEVPVVAIGGINKHNAPELFQAGADAVAVLGALFCVDNVQQEARALSSLAPVRGVQLQI
jgi:thiamine-phosphate pyrophosphorylase